MGIQILPQSGSISGRIGKGIGEGISAALPKVVERRQLKEGLSDFEKNHKGLTPLEQYTRLASIPGITPSMLQALPEILKQQGQAQALTNGIGKGEAKTAESQPKKQERFPNPNENKPVGEKPSKSITTTEPVQNTINAYIPKTYDEIIERAGQLYNENPALYKSDPQLAMQAAVQEDQSNQSINTAQQNKRKTQQDVQTRVQTELSNAARNAGVEIPDNVYSEIEDAAIDDVNTGKRSEFEAAKYYKKELDAISRDYKALDTVGNWNVVTRTPEGNKSSLKSIRQKFKERNDLENLADSYISKNGLSPSKAYYLAYPVSEEKPLNNYIAKLPKIHETRSEDPSTETLKIAPDIAKIMGDGSPLSIAEELKSRGYDPETWMNYIDKNRKKIDMKARQERELDKPRTFTPSMNDLWMFLFSGLDKIVEMK